MPTVLERIVANQWQEITPDMDIGDVDQALLAMGEKHFCITINEKKQVLDDKSTPEKRLLERMGIVVQYMNTKKDEKLIALTIKTLDKIILSKRLESYKQGFNALRSQLNSQTSMQNLRFFDPTAEGSDLLLRLQASCKTFINNAPLELTDLKRKVVLLESILNNNKLTADQKIKDFQQEFEVAFKDQLPLYLTLPIIGDFCRAVLEYFNINPIDIVAEAEKALKINKPF